MPTSLDVLLPIDVAIVDTDLLWRVEHMNAVRVGLTKEFGTLADAAPNLEPGRAAVVVLGPNPARSVGDDWTEIEELHTRQPQLRFVIIRDGPGPDAVSEESASWATWSGADTDLPTFESIIARLQSEVAHTTLPAGIAESGIGPNEVATPRRNPTNMIVVTSAKGGEGVTTVATNLAVAIVQASGVRVALVDTDASFGDLGLVLHQPPLTRPVARSLPLDDATVDSLISVHRDSGLLVVRAPQVAGGLAGREPEMLDDLLRAVGTRADVIVVDTPISALTETMRAAFMVLVVTGGTTASLKNALVAGKMLGAQANVFAVLNGVRLLTHDRDLRALAASTGLPVLACLPYEGKLHRASKKSTPAVIADPHSGYARVIETMVHELTARTPMHR